MSLGHICSFSPFLLLLPCLAACFVVYVLAVGCWGWMGKGAAFAGFLGSIRKRRKLYMFLVMLSLGFFERLVWLLWGVIGGLGPLRFVGKEGIFCIFGLGKVLFMEFWRAGTVVLFVFVMLLFFSSISFVCIELCLRIANVIAHYT